MTDVPFPLLNAPGRQPQAAGGKLINCYPETLPATAGKPYAYWRTAGMRPWGTSPGANYRGALLVGNLIYAVIDNTVYQFPATGGAGVPMTGAIPGTAPVTMARNLKATPDIVIVAPGDGAFIAPATGVVQYPGTTIGQPNAVCYIASVFIFSYGDGSTSASDPSSLNVNALNFATAESKPDTLFRPVPLGTGQLLLCGSNSIEVWGGENDTGYIFSYSSTINRGIVGPAAIAGQDDGFGKGIFFVGDDFKVSTLNGYTATPISVPDLDLLIEAEPDKSQITVSVYVAQGHGMVVVQGPQWCWEYDTTLQSWHQRQSYLQQYWRGQFPIWAFGTWYCGDLKSGNVFAIDGKTSTEGGLQDVSTLTMTGAPTGGTFALSYNLSTTIALAFNATAAQIQTALQAIGANVVVSGALPTITIAFVADGPQSAITATGNLTGGAGPAVAVAHSTTGIAGDPLLITIETGPLGAFPNKVRIDGIELYLTKGVGIATGLDPLQTDPDVSISISRDGGQTWSNPRIVKIGRQALTDGRVRAAIWGQAQNQGVRWRLRESAPLSFAFMGADMQADQLR